ncbi:MAG: HdeD family acid-resistance protein [Pirellulaceae bacterium]
MNAKAADVEEFAEEIRHEMQDLRDDWWLFVFLGLLLIACGAFVVVYPVFGTITFTVAIGAALIVAGVATIIGAFWSGRWSGFFLQMLVGIFYAVLGFAILDSPTDAISVMTLLIAAFFVVIGIFRIVVSLSLRFPSWGWALVAGVLTTMVGVIIFKTHESSQAWVIGLLVAVELIANGWYWTMLGMTVKDLPVDDEEEEEE